MGAEHPKRRVVVERADARYAERGGGAQRQIRHKPLNKAEKKKREDDVKRERIRQKKLAEARRLQMQKDLKKKKGPQKFQAQAALRDESPDSLRERVHVGDRCVVAPGARVGVVMYIGDVPETKCQGDFVAVKYDKPVGKNDGSIKGKRYFKAKKNYGGFVRPAAVKILEPDWEEFKTKDNKIYYYNHKTGQTMWTIPKAPFKKSKDIHIMPKPQMVPMDDIVPAPASDMGTEDDLIPGMMDMGPGFDGSKNFGENMTYTAEPAAIDIEPQSVQFSPPVLPASVPQLPSIPAIAPMPAAPSHVPESPVMPQQPIAVLADAAPSEPIPRKFDQQNQPPPPPPGRPPSRPAKDEDDLDEEDDEEIEYDEDKDSRGRRHSREYSLSYHEKEAMPENQPEEKKLQLTPQQLQQLQHLSPEQLTTLGKSQNLSTSQIAQLLQIRLVAIQHRQKLKQAETALAKQQQLKMMQQQNFQKQQQIALIQKQQLINQQQLQMRAQQVAAFQQQQAAIKVGAAKEVHEKLDAAQKKLAEQESFIESQKQQLAKLEEEQKNIGLEKKRIEQREKQLREEEEARKKAKEQEKKNQSKVRDEDGTMVYHKQNKAPSFISPEEDESAQNALAKALADAVVEIEDDTNKRDKKEKKPVPSVVIIDPDAPEEEKKDDIIPKGYEDLISVEEANTVSDIRDAVCFYADMPHQKEKLDQSIHKLLQLLQSDIGSEDEWLQIVTEDEMAFVGTIGYIFETCEDHMFHELVQILYIIASLDPVNVFTFLGINYDMGTRIIKKINALPEGEMLVARLLILLKILMNCPLEQVQLNIDHGQLLVNVIDPTSNVLVEHAMKHKNARKLAESSIALINKADPLVEQASLTFIRQIFEDEDTQSFYKTDEIKTLINILLKDKIAPTTEGDPVLYEYLKTLDSLLQWSKYKKEKYKYAEIMKLLAKLDKTAKNPSSPNTTTDEETCSLIVEMISRYK